MTRFQAVIFDFDGTLARTMEDHFRAWQAVMAEYGIALAPDDYYPLEGVRVAELPGRFFAKRDQPPRDEEAIVRRKERYYLAHHSFALYPGVEEITRQLHERHVPMAIVTAGLLDRLKRSAPEGFLERFDALVTGEDTPEGKPSPQPYLRGAEQLGVRPEACIVVENAPLGIESAKRAGAYCVALCSTVRRQELSLADEVLESFAELQHAPAIRALLQLAPHPALATAR